jgi:hypothetical protein
VWGVCRQLYFESTDRDRYTRRLSPVTIGGGVTGGASGITNVLNSYEDRRWDFDYTSGLRLSRFTTIVELGGEYSISYAGTPPQQQQLSMSGNSAGEAVLVRIKCVPPDQC